MKKYSQIYFVIIFVIALVGCESNRTRVGEGAALGGLMGATVGGIVGHQSGHGVGGALAAGAVGAAAGGIVGAQMEKQPKASSKGYYSQVSMQDIVGWTRQGLSSDEIITRINASTSEYYITPDDISYLRREGVSERVIEALQNKK